MASYHTRERVLRGAGPIRVTEVATVREGFFAVVGVPALKGAVPRLAGGDGRAVVSAALARAVEDETGRPAVGQAVTIGDGRYDVAAVMPAGFAFPSAEVDAWVADQPNFRGETGTVGRMRHGVSLAQVRDDAARVVREVLAARGAPADSWGAAVTPVEETLLGEVRPVLRVSVAAALLVLVVVCANAATLLVGRSVARRREFAVRIAVRNARHHRRKLQAAHRPRKGGCRPAAQRGRKFPNPRSRRAPRQRSRGPLLLDGLLRR